MSLIRTIAEMPEPAQRYVLNGAVFVIGILIGLVYLAATWQH